MPGGIELRIQLNELLRQVRICKNHAFSRKLECVVDNDIDRFAKIEMSLALIEDRVKGLADDAG